MLSDRLPEEAGGLLGGTLCSGEAGPPAVGVTSAPAVIEGWSA